MNSAAEDALPAAQSSVLTELVEIAPAATVSRVLARSGGGNVTLFAFAAGQELEEHSAPFDALVLLLHGALELTIGGEPVTMQPGQIVRMPARVPHALRSPSDSKMLLVMLRDRVEGG